MDGLAWLDMMLVVTGAVYVLSVLWLVVGLRRSAPAPAMLSLPSLSIIVAARNEERALPACLEALRAQSYAGEWEVIVVDDRSGDGTGDLVKQMAQEWPALHWVRASEEPLFRCPKKSALAQGIATAKGEILLFTDADCRPPGDWAQKMVAHFAEDVGLVAGHARPELGFSFVQRLLALDNLAIGALGAGSFAMGKPLSCTGRNLAYRREVYEEVGGFSRIGHLIGGDDVYFMRLVAESGRWRQVFSRSAVVSCLPSSSRWGQILQQKMRHSAKGGHYGGAALLLSGAVYLFHLALGWALIRVLFGGAAPVLLWPVWALRWAVDALLLHGMAEAEDGPWWRYFPALQVVYIPYVVLVAAAGRLGFFRWKS